MNDAVRSGDLAFLVLLDGGRRYYLDFADDGSGVASLHPRDAAPVMIIAPGGSEGPLQSRFIVSVSHRGYHDGSLDWYLSFSRPVGSSELVRLDIVRSVVTANRRPVVFSSDRAPLRYDEPFHVSTPTHAFLKIDSGALGVGRSGPVECLLLKYEDAYSCVGRGFCRPVSPREQLALPGGAASQHRTLEACADACD